MRGQRGTLLVMDLRYVIVTALQPVVPRIYVLETSETVLGARLADGLPRRTGLQDTMLQHAGPSTKYKIFMKDLQEAMDIMLPWKIVRVHTSDRPWITKKLKTLIRKRQLAFHRHGRDSNCYKLLRVASFFLMQAILRQCKWRA